MLLDDTQIQLTGRWEFHINPIVPNQFHSFHATNHTGDLASLNFTGTAIEVYGIVGPTNGNYSVELDGIESQFSGFSQTQQQSLLFSQGSLDDSMEHQLVVTNLLEGNLLTIDLLNITQSSLPSSPPRSSAISRGSIIAIALIAAFCFLILLGALVYLFLRRRRSRATEDRRVRADESIAPRMRSIGLPSDRGRSVLEEQYPWMRDGSATPGDRRPSDAFNRVISTPYDPYTPRLSGAVKIQPLPAATESVIDILPRTRSELDALRPRTSTDTPSATTFVPTPAPGDGFLAQQRSRDRERNASRRDYIRSDPSVYSS